MRTVMFIVQYSDPDHPGEGLVKTRHFPELEGAVKFAGRLQPPVYGVEIVKQVTSITRERVFGNDT